MNKLVTLWKRPSHNGRSFTYYLLYMDEQGKRRQKSLGHADYRKAERQRAQFERELRMGIAESGPMRLRQFSENSLTRTGDQIRESTHREYESSIEDFIKVVGNIDYRKITLKHGELYRQSCLDKGNSPATVAKKLRQLKRLFQLAVNRKQLDENPLQHIEMPKSPKKKVNIYSPQDCERILKASRDFCQKQDKKTSLKWDLLIIVALSTAMRRGELLNCTWGDIDFEEQSIEVSPKQDTAETWEWLVKDTDRRELPLTDEIAQLLADHQSKQPDGYPCVFVPIVRYDFIQQELRAKGEWNLSDSRLKVVNNFARQFDSILSRANVRKGNFHDLRRTALSNWFANGMSENDIMTLAGHSSFATTREFYLAVADDLLDRARQATAQAIGKICCKSVANAF